MNKREKRLASQLPGGIGSNVIDGDIKYALSVWKQDLKKSGVVFEVFKRKEFNKPSYLRKQILDAAKFRSKIKKKV